MNGDSRSSSPAPAAIVARIRANSPRASRVAEMFAVCPASKRWIRADASVSDELVLRIGTGSRDLQEIVSN
jgi:hypothetical protein